MDHRDYPVMSSKSSDPQQRRPDSRMYFVESAEESGSVDWQISNAVDWQRQICSNFTVLRRRLLLNRTCRLTDWDVGINLTSSECHDEDKLSHDWLIAPSDFLLLDAVYTVWVKKIPPWGFLTFFVPNGWEFLVQILHTYYTFLSVPEYKFLFNYLQLWRSYAVLSATTQRIFTFH